MLQALTHASAFWGFLGCFIYAGPRVSVCYYAAREAKTPSLRCFWEAVVALISGSIAAAAFSGWLAHLIHLNDAKALATLIGLVANPVAPGIVELLSGNILNRLRGGH